MPRPKPSVIVLLALFGASGPALAESGTDPSHLRAVQDDLAAARKAQAEAAARRDRLKAEMDRLRNDLVGKAAEAQAREREASAIEGRLAELQVRDAEKRAALDRRRTEISGLLAALTRLSRRPPALLITGPRSAVDLAHAGIALGGLVADLRRQAGRLRQDLAELEAVRRDLDRERTGLDKRLAALATTRADLDRLLKRRADDAAALDRTLATEAASVSRLAAKAKSIEALIAALERDRQERAAEAARLAAAEARRAAAEAAAEAAIDASTRAPAAVSPERNAGPIASAMPVIPDTAGRFSQLRGRLGWPAAGTLIGRYGERQDNDLVARGARLATRPGAQVIAPAAGEIAFAGPFRGYGHLLILAYGDGYHLLLAGLERIDTTVGQPVVAGEPLGQMGQTVNGARPTLYVELRHNGEPVDYGPWLASRATKVSDR